MRPKTAPTRRLGLLDAMILVAAIAPGLAWSRFSQTIPKHIAGPFGMMFDGATFDPGRPMLDILARLWVWYGRVVPVVVTGALGLLVVRLRRPRPRGRRVFLQPGTAACGAVVLGMGLATLRLGILLAKRAEYSEILGPDPGWPWWLELCYVFALGEIAALVLGSWATLALAGRMRCERSAIDRLGRAVGIFWLVGPPLCWAVRGLW